MEPANETGRWSLPEEQTWWADKTITLDLDNTDGQLDQKGYVREPLLIMNVGASPEVCFATGDADAYDLFCLAPAED